MTVSHGAMRWRAGAARTDSFEAAPAPGRVADAAPSLSPAPAMPFVLASTGETLVARGWLESVAEGLEPPGARVRRLLAGGEGPRLVVGALPFAAQVPAHLYRPAELSRRPGRSDLASSFPLPRRAESARPARWQVTPEPTLAAYEAAVAAALVRMAQSQEGLRKIVLSRSLKILADRPIDAAALLRALARDVSVAAFCVPLPSAGAPRVLVGATPELLVSKRGRDVTSHPLAGSSRRARAAAADRAAAQALLGSEKDRREHREVVEAILDQLAPHCTDLAAPGEPELTSTASMWHLGTPIAGRLRDDTLSALDLALLLHPTPAVCGTPRAAAARAIAELEGYERGFYAGAVGWCEASGDGDWHVAIRCAELSGCEARLSAGAGIVAGSDPAAEGEETSAKFAALLTALGIDEKGAPLMEERA
ncbi:isochorismate synthase [Ancylobacter vacuolatus]|uniref:isochorismate synthase n=1 Tax=Ancylobacter vacuolatus TaxID=223389 RepID=A0ABU0DDA9_9HYPH|nr:isochorismate synthase [Ancylobacter vacuolatus]MDQ0346397.1 isochorismate synthase [Ancylobacter vacuolatus]